MKRKQTGLTMIEVLIAVLVLAVGLLGVAGMQTVSMQQTQGADRRSVAVLYVQTMADEIRSQKGLPSTSVKDDWVAEIKNDLGDSSTGEVTAVGADPVAKVKVTWTSRTSAWDKVATGDDALSAQSFEVTVRYAQ